MGAVRCQRFGRCDPSPNCGEPLLHPGAWVSLASARSVANKRKGENSMRTTGMGTAIVRYCLALMAVLLLAFGAFAQSTTNGAIGGLVTDQSGAVVPGAYVTALNID